MRSDAVERAAQLRAVRLSAEIEVALEGNSNGPLLYLLDKGRERCAEAIAKLIEVHPTDEKNITALQVEIACFRRICDWLFEAVTEGAEADTELSAEARDDLRDVLGITDLEAEAMERTGFIVKED